jgi:hypothetical protein
MAFLGRLVGAWTVALAVGACSVANAPADALPSDDFKTVPGAVPTCPENTEVCGHACVDLKKNRLHCGACDQACAADKQCVMGKCQTVCGGASVLCGTMCVDVKADPLNCGDCNKTCAPAANSVAYCGGGMCQSQCQPLFKDCDLKSDNGCEVNVSADAANCGTCGAVCPATAAHAKPMCTAGSCAPNCDMGFGNCDGDVLNGCEADLAKDDKNCSMCGMACPMDKPYCQNGMCSAADPDLVLYFNFDEATGDAIDHSNPKVNQTNGTFMGLVSRVPGGALNSANAMRSPAAGGPNDYLAINGMITKLNAPTAYSLMAWIKVASAGNGKGLLIFGSCCNTRQGYTINLQSNATLRFWGGTDVTNTNFNGNDPTNLNDNVFHHIGIRVDAANGQFMIDGNPKGTFPTNVPTSPSLANPNNDDGAEHLPQVGGRGIDLVSGADVYFDEVKIYKRKLSDTDWQAAMNGKL